MKSTMVSHQQLIGDVKSMLTTMAKVTFVRLPQLCDLLWHNNVNKLSAEWKYHILFLLKEYNHGDLSEALAKAVLKVWLSTTELGEVGWPHGPTDRAPGPSSFVLKVGDIKLCSWARHFTLIVPLSTQLYKYVPSNLMLGVTL